MAVLDPITLRLAHYNAKKHPDDEQRDFCSVSHDLGPDEAILPPEAYQESGLFRSSSVPHGGKILKSIKGMGTIYDWRSSPWTPSNGGTIKPLVFVQHIPVVPNMAGIADFIRLRDVLVAQGLMVQNATDKDGNVALYTPMNSLCYQARGANQQSCGTEHMHMTLGETWSKRQLRASAWLVNLALEKHGIPTYAGVLAGGGGIARVSKRGQVTHKRVSQAAGFNDRSDPGDGYDDEYVRRAVQVWRERIRNGQADSKGMEGI